MILSKPVKKFLILGAVASIVGGIFKMIIIGTPGTELTSVIFGFQWLFCLGYALKGVVVGLSNTKKHTDLLRRSVVGLGFIILIALPSRYVEVNDIYAKDGIKPTGPTMGCLIWNKSIWNGSYSSGFHRHLGACATTSMVSYGAYLNPFYAPNRSSSTRPIPSDLYYLATLAIYELALAGAFIKAAKNA
jgi:hypothetical protein